MAVATTPVLGKADPKHGLDATNRFRHRRDQANRLRRFNRNLLSRDDELRSIARCGNALGSLVPVRCDQHGRMRPGGIATCKSVWGCLGCAARKRAEHAAVVKWFVDRHHHAGGHVSLGSFTLAHYPTDNLSELLEGLRKSFTDMRRMKTYKTAETTHGIVGWIGALEITDGPSGWHPHLHVLFFHQDYLGIEDGDNAPLRTALHETFAYQINRHLGRQVHQTHGVDLVPVKTSSDDGAVARYLGKIQLEMTRQDLKTGRGQSRSPWQIALDAANTNNPQDTARWIEYLQATKGRNVVTHAKTLDHTYGTPTDQEINTMLGIQDQQDDQADEDDDAQDVASIDSTLWNDARNIITPNHGALTAAALTELETHGLHAMAQLFSNHLNPVEVINHPETGLPHLRYKHRPDTITVATGDTDGQTNRIDYNNLGPVARAWYGAADEPGEMRE